MTLICLASFRSVGVAAAAGAASTQATASATRVVKRPVFTNNLLVAKRKKERTPPQCTPRFGVSLERREDPEVARQDCCVLPVPAWISSVPAAWSLAPPRTPGVG